LRQLISSCVSDPRGFHQQRQARAHVHPGGSHAAIARCRTRSRERLARAPARQLRDNSVSEQLRLDLRGALHHGAAIHERRFASADPGCLVRHLMVRARGGEDDRGVVGEDEAYAACIWNSDHQNPAA